MTQRIKLTYTSFLQSKIKLKCIDGKKHFSISDTWILVPPDCQYDLFVVNKYGTFNKE